MAKKAVKKKKAAKISEAEDRGFYAPQGALRAIGYVVSLLAPGLGFMIGLIFFSQKNNDSRSFGKICFILMGIGLFILLLWFIVAIIVGLVTGGAAAMDMNFGESYY